MAFSHSRILRVVTKYSQEVNDPYSLDPKKMVYDPVRYGYQYSNKMIKEGFEQGQRFLSRTPKYREMHPEIMDTIKAQRAILFFVLVGIFIMTNNNKTVVLKEDRERYFKIFKDKAFVGAYSYKQREVEYVPRVNPPYPY